MVRRSSCWPYGSTLGKGLLPESLPLPGPGLPAGRSPRRSPRVRGRRRVRCAKRITMSNSTPETSAPSSAIESLSEETRRFAPPAEFAAQAIARPGIYEEAERDYVEFWACWARKLEWMKPFTSGARMEGAVRDVVRRRRTQRLGQLPRPPRARGQGRQSRLLLRRRARRSPDDHLSRVARRRLPLRQRPAQAGHQEGRPRRHLHADDSGAAGRDAGVRAHRRGAFGDLRRLLARFDRGPRQRRAVRRASSPPTDGWRRGNKVPLKRNSTIAMEQTPSIKHCIVAKRVGDEREHARRARRLVGRGWSPTSPRRASPSA